MTPSFVGCEPSATATRSEDIAMSRFHLGCVVAVPGSLRAPRGGHNSRLESQWRLNSRAPRAPQIPLHEFTPPRLDRTVSMEGNPFYTPEDRLPESSPSLALQATPYATRDEATSTTPAPDTAWTARAKAWLRHKASSHPAGPATSTGDVEQQQQQRSKPAKVRDSIRCAWSIVRCLYRSPTAALQLCRGCSHRSHSVQATQARTQRHWMSESGSNVATSAASAYVLHAVASERERDNARHKNCAWFLRRRPLRSLLFTPPSRVPVRAVLL
jgi:hypothetical protein